MRGGLRRLESVVVGRRVDENYGSERGTPKSEQLVMSQDAV